MADTSAHSFRGVAALFKSLQPIRKMLVFGRPGNRKVARTRRTELRTMLKRSKMVNYGPSPAPRELGGVSMKGTWPENSGPRLWGLRETRKLELRLRTPAAQPSFGTVVFGSAVVKIGPVHPSLASPSTPDFFRDAWKITKSLCSEDTEALQKRDIGP